MQHVGSLLRLAGFSVVVACGFSLSGRGTWAPEAVGTVGSGTQALSLRRASSVVVSRGLSCPATCEILVPRPGIEPCPLHWKADSLPLDHRGSPYGNLLELKR